MMEGREVFLRRILILQTLSARREGVTARELTTEHGVNLKTIRRDLELLDRMGFTLEQKTGEGGRKFWKLSPEAWNPPAIQLTMGETLALFLGQRLLEPLAGTNFWIESRTALAKIRATLGPFVLKYVDKLAPAFHFTSGGVASYSHQGELIDQLQLAVEESRVSQLTYLPQRATEAVTYETHPLGFIYHRGFLYLVADVPNHGFRHFKLNRVSEVDVWQLRFKRPADFDLAKHLQGTFGVYLDNGDQHITVRVRFSNDVARFVEEGQWHTSQSLSRQADGSLIAEFSLTNTTELKSWILGFGAKAQILEPAQLIQDVRDELTEMLTRYSPEGTANRPVRATRPK